MALLLDTDAGNETVFQEVKIYFEKNQIPLTNVIACATDGAPSMIDRYCGFIALLIAPNLQVLTIYCLIHRQHFMAKNISGRFNLSLKTVIKAVNKIKDQALNTRLFKQLSNENDEAFERLLLHTKARWLSKKNCHARFYSLSDAAWNSYQVATLALQKKLLL